MANNNPKLGWSIIFHGGAKDTTTEEVEQFRQGCEDAPLEGQKFLQARGKARDAVESAIRITKNDTTFNAERSAVLNNEGVVECDSAIMKKRTLTFCGRAAIRGFRHSISVAASLLKEKPILLVGAGAERLAIERGNELLTSASDPTSVNHDADPECDMVGCEAQDMADHLAGTSTGGVAGIILMDSKGLSIGPIIAAISQSLTLPATHRINHLRDVIKTFSLATSKVWSNK